MIRDDIYEYSLDAHHDEEAGKKIRKKIYFVTILLTVVTIIEVAMGALAGRSISSGMTWEMIKWGYVGLTLVKAGYIVMVFMHLGDERKGLKYVILVPYMIFIIYLIFILLWEGTMVGQAWPSTYVR